MKDQPSKSHASGSGSTTPEDVTIEALRRKLEDALQNYEILTKATNDAVRDWNVQSKSMEWNHGLYSIFGYEKVSLNYDEWANGIHPDDATEVLNGLDTAFTQRQSNWSAIYRFRCFNGYYKYTFDRGYTIYDPSGKPSRMIGTMQDIDERMVALSEIEKLSMVASRTENLVIITDASEKIEWVNDGFVKRTGYTLYDVIGKTPRIMQGPHTDKLTLSRIRKKIDACEHVSEEVLNYTKNGEELWLKLNINPVFDNHHNVVRLIAVETDVTQQKEYESTITSFARELSDLIENANAIIFGVDRDGRVNEWNKQAIAATGYAKRDVLGQKLTSFVKGLNSRRRVDAYIEQVLDGNPISHQEFQMINRSDEKDIFLLSATPRRNTKGEIIGMIAVGQDITELTEYRMSLEKKVMDRTRELQNALEKEKELATLKTRFASMVSHEFRTPLSAISISANQIRQYRSRLAPEDIDKKLDSIQSQVSHMARLLEDVLVIGKGEEGIISVVKRRVNPYELIMAIKGEVENQFKNSHTVQFTNELSSPHILSDDDLLRNVLINLLSNAIKFSPGSDKVYLNVFEENDSVVFQIKDDGIGIPSVDLERVFEAFSRGTNVTTISGTGLGLSIVKKATELLGGHVSVTSKVGYGTTFSVTIPVS